MRVVKTVAELRQWRTTGQLPVGFVPTMGYLHEGHLSLVRRARAENASVVVSIFVNPTQFGPHEDFQSYPRDLERDLRMLSEAGVDAVFTPAVEDMYPEGGSTFVEVEGLNATLEGASRPGHFRGVATVVCKLFHAVEPQRAYFGEKDFQQLRLIQHMVRDLLIPIEVIGCPTVREPDGLAMSSRNVFLNAAERRAATSLSHALFEADRQVKAGERDAARLHDLVVGFLQREPLARIDYVAVVDAHTLSPLTTIGPEGAQICLAVRIGNTRLIDNLHVPSDG